MDINQLAGGTTLTEKIAEAILNADIFVCCITKKYIESEICNDEIHYAKNAKKTIIPLMFERLNEHDLKGIGLIITKLLRINVYKDPNEAHSWSGEISEQLIKAITESFNVTRNGCVEVSSNVGIILLIKFFIFYLKLIKTNLIFIIFRLRTRV